MSDSVRVRAEFAFLACSGRFSGPCDLPRITDHVRDKPCAEKGDQSEADSRSAAVGEQRGENVPRAGNRRLIESHQPESRE
jgi:hypothetical protein